MPDPRTPLDKTARAGPAALTLLVSLTVGSTWYSSCTPRSSGEPPPTVASAASTPAAASPTLAQPPPSPTPAPTCWDAARSPEDRRRCAQAEVEAAEDKLDTVLARVLASAGPGLQQATRAAQRAWLRYRDAHLSSLVLTAPEAASQVEDETCDAILSTWLTRGRVGELRRMLPPGLHDPPTDEASCEVSADCEQADQWVEDAYERATQASRPADLGRIEASQQAWISYMAAETAAILAAQQSSEPELRARIRDAARARLSAIRSAHLDTFGAHRRNARERCQQLQTDATTLAGLEAECDAGLAQGCDHLGGALEWGWYGIDRDLPRARSVYRTACELGSGTACASLAYALSVGRGVGKDPERAAAFLERGCDAGDAPDCQRLALAHATGDGIPQDFGQAIAVWQHACELSVSDPRTYWPEGRPCQRLAAAFESGDPIPQDLGRALALYEDACQRDQAGSCVDAAHLLRRREGFDTGRVISLYRRDCSGNGDVAACVELGDLYREGNGIPLDEDAAIESYQEACRAGFVPGCRALSAMTGAPMGDPDEPVSDPGYIKTVRFVLGDDMPPLRVRLFGDDYGTIMRMQIVGLDEGGSSQEISIPESEDSEPGAKLPLGQVDLNFDGYNDLTLRSWEGAQNYGSFVWIFDPSHRRFVYSPELSEISTLQADPEQHVLRSYYHFSAMEGSVSEYRWIEGRPVLVREESSHYIDTDDGRCLEYVKKEFVRGKLVETEHSCQ